MTIMSSEIKEKNDPTDALSPRVSVIIPAYNTSQYIAETLDSVYAQTFTDFEVVVVNDGSRDTELLEKILQPYIKNMGLRYFKKENGGASSARNFGVRAARGQYMAMLDSDDIWLPNYLEHQVSTLDSDPRIAACYTNATIFGDSPLSGKDFMSIFGSEGEVTFQSMIEEKVHVVGTSTARKDVMLDAGLYDESLPTSEDFDLWIRIAHKGWRIVYTKKQLFRYRRRAGCLSNDQIGFWSTFLRVMENIQRRLSLSPADAMLIDSRLTYIRANLNLYEGKQAFFSADIPRAISLLTQANDFFHSTKLAIVIRLLQFAPNLLLSLYEFRDRFYFRKNTMTP